MAKRAGLPPYGTDRSVLNRIAVEELETWFLGDMEAVAVAFPRVPVSTSGKAGFRDPDAVRGGTAQKLEALLGKYGYYGTGLAKVDAARRIAPHMKVDDNLSRSFQVFRDGVRSLTNIGAR